MGFGSLLGGIGTVLGLGSSVYGAIQGAKEQKRANQLQDKALAQAEQEYSSRAPLRRQGLQILGQSEAPIDMGMLGYNPTNPFARARGMTPSNATRFQSQPGFGASEADAALGLPPQQASPARPRVGVQPLQMEPDTYQSLRYRR